MKMDVNAKYIINVYLLGILVSFIMLGVTSLFGIIGLEVVWTDFLGILLSLLVVPFIYGCVIHGIDSVLANQSFGSDIDTLKLIWIVGVVVAFILVGVAKFFELFGLQASLTDIVGVALLILVVPWITGFVAKTVDDYLTG